MGKSQFKLAADFVVDHCLEKGYRTYADSDYYWAYRLLFENTSSTFDLNKFREYIQKRINGKDQ